MEPFKCNQKNPFNIVITANRSKAICVGNFVIMEHTQFFTEGKHFKVITINRSKCNQGKLYMLSWKTNKIIQGIQWSKQY